MNSMTSYSSLTQVFIIVAAITLHNYIRQKAQRDLLFDKYNNDDLIVIDSNDEYEDNDLSSYLYNVIESFRDSLLVLCTGSWDKNMYVTVL